MEKQKVQYVSPQIEVIKMEMEGVIAGSGGSTIGDMGVEQWSNSRSGARGATRGYSASSSDLEDMINDILTVGE